TVTTRALHAALPICREYLPNRHYLSRACPCPIRSPAHDKDQRLFSVWFQVCFSPQYCYERCPAGVSGKDFPLRGSATWPDRLYRSEEHTSELQSREN